MAKFNTEGAMKGSEPDAILTPARKISSRPVESAEKLDSLMKTARRCSLHREKSNKQKKQAWDMENVYSINRDDTTEKIDITKIMHSMKRGKRSARQRVKSSAPWAQPFGFLNSSRVTRARRNDQAVSSKKMKRTRRGTKPLRANTRAANKKKNVGDDGNSSNQSIPAKAVNFDNSRVESAAEPLSADSMACCVEFAVKLLKDEIPLPAGVSEIEEFFKQMICLQKSTIPGPSQSSLSRKG
ncbi:unnamed protein product [Urochloa decumbens]|uniref:Uncharacterized protein n=1 Tax=Urochloa decumbens TaxID=240449 RepID=A0ABC9CM55_9POAL